VPGATADITPLKTWRHFYRINNDKITISRPPLSLSDEAGVVHGEVRMNYSQGRIFSRVRSAGAHRPPFLFILASQREIKSPPFEFLTDWAGFLPIGVRVGACDFNTMKFPH